MVVTPPSIVKVAVEGPEHEVVEEVVWEIKKQTSPPTPPKIS